MRNQEQELLTNKPGFDGSGDGRGTRRGENEVQEEHGEDQTDGRGKLKKLFSDCRAL